MTTRYLSPQAYDRVIALIDERRAAREAIKGNDQMTLAEKLRLRRRIDEIGLEIAKVEG